MATSDELVLPPYFLRRPPMPRDAETLAAFDALYARAEASGGAVLDYNLKAPIWQFFCHVADIQPVLLHGSGNAAIDMFEPRQPHDVSAFGDQNAVYAASDGLWPMYFAILDRARFEMSLINSSMQLDLGDGRRGEPFYFFSISDKALMQRPFRDGTIYLLPRDGFMQQPPFRHEGRDIHVAHWASLAPVKPLARFAVQPEDFPLLAQLRGHDDEPTFARARANPDGFPWVEDDQPKR
jgi:hypothetical protein